MVFTSGKCKLSSLKMVLIFLFRFALCYCLWITIELPAHFSWIFFEEILQFAHCCSVSKCLVPDNPHGYNFLTQLKSADQSPLPPIQTSVFQLSTRRDEKTSGAPSAGEFSMEGPAENESSDPRLQLKQLLMSNDEQSNYGQRHMQWVRHQIQRFPSSSWWDVRLNQISFGGKKILRGFVWERWKLLFWVKWKVLLLFCSSDVFASVIRAIF